MLDEVYFKNKFSVGLAMNTTVMEFEEFLKKYAFFIDNIYVSPPLGDQYHGREYVKEQFHDPGNVEKFWRLLELLQLHEIDLEVVFNTDILQAEDFQCVKREFEKRGIAIKKIAVFDKYIRDVQFLFPKSKIVKTVNEMPNSIAGFRKLPDEYDEIVIGRQYIRNTEVLHIIKEQLRAVPVLLLNNGCSFYCGGCLEMSHCKNTYESSAKKMTPEYLYAQQSILPYELHEKWLDIWEIGLLKLSTRNADMEFTARCIDSYIRNNAENLIKEKVFNYLLWARLKWHIPYFKEFDYDRIKDIKRKFYN